MLRPLISILNQIFGNKSSMEKILKDKPNDIYYSIWNSDNISQWENLIYSI